MPDEYIRESHYQTYTQFNPYAMTPQRCEMRRKENRKRKKKIIKIGYII